MAKHYNQRQRKKLRIGEFAEFGFAVNASFQPNTETDVREALLDAFITALEGHGLVAGGSCEPAGLDVYVMTGKASESATDEHRAAVEAWLKARPELADVTVEALTDANHGWDVL
jgi:uncharacterized protein YggL (DUF469 family)